MLAQYTKQQKRFIITPPSDQLAQDTQHTYILNMIFA